MGETFLRSGLLSLESVVLMLQGVDRNVPRS